MQNSISCENTFNFAITFYTDTKCFENFDEGRFCKTYKT